jgi:hypothetical protein
MNLSFLIFVNIFLALVAAILFLYIKRRKKILLKASQETQERANLQNKEYVNNSIIMITKATLQGQCETSEACLRLYNLLKSVSLPKAIEQRMLVINEMYNEMEQLSYLDKRHKLTNQERLKEDKLRYSIEEKYSKPFAEALSELRDYMISVS